MITIRGQKQQFRYASSTGIAIIPAFSHPEPVDQSRLQAEPAGETDPQSTTMRNPRPTGSTLLGAATQARPSARVQRTTSPSENFL